MKTKRLMMVLAAVAVLVLVAILGRSVSDCFRLRSEAAEAKASAEEATARMLELARLAGEESGALWSLDLEKEMRPMLLRHLDSAVTRSELHLAQRNLAEAEAEIARKEKRLEEIAEKFGGPRPKWFPVDGEFDSDMRREEQRQAGKEFYAARRAHWEKLAEIDLDRQRTENDLKIAEARVAAMDRLRTAMVAAGSMTQRDADAASQQAAMELLAIQEDAVEDLRANAERRTGELTRFADERIRLLAEMKNAGLRTEELAREPVAQWAD